MSKKDMRACASFGLNPPKPMVTLGAQFTQSEAFRNISSAFRNLGIAAASTTLAYGTLPPMTLNEGDAVTFSFTLTVT